MLCLIRRSRFTWLHVHLFIGSWQWILRFPDDRTAGWTVCCIANRSRVERIYASSLKTTGNVGDVHLSTEHIIEDTAKVISGNLSSWVLLHEYVTRLIICFFHGTKYSSVQGLEPMRCMWRETEHFYIIAFGQFNDFQ